MQLLELAHLAPSVENTQPWKFHVILDTKLRHALMETSCYGNFIEGAGAFIVVTVNTSLVNLPPEPIWNPKELEYSCMAAMEHILLGATAMGLGSCWISLHHGASWEALRLEPHEAVVGGVMVGHYRKGEGESAGHHQRRPLKDACMFHE